MICSDPVLDEKVKRCKYLDHEVHKYYSSNIDLFSSTASEKISENMHIIANDPSLAFYRIQEHIRKGNHPFKNHNLDTNFQISFPQSNANDCRTSFRS